MRALIIWNILISLLLTFLLYSVFIKPQTSSFISDTDTSAVKAVTPSDSNVSSAVEAPIAFVNTDSLFKQLEMYKDMEEELIAERMKAENRYRGEAQKLEKDYNNLRDKAQFMTQAQGEIEQAKLMSRRDELLKMEEDLSEKLATKESASLQKIKDTLEAFLERYNREKGYHYILGKSQIGGILYANYALDITADVVSGLNAEYKAKNSNK